MAKKRYDMKMVRKSVLHRWDLEPREAIELQRKLASHIGLWLGIPTVGCAKSRLCGEHREPGRHRGASAVLRLDGKIVGRVLRTRDNVKPLYVSVGHMIDLKTTTDLVFACCGRYRLPEPTRLAHHAAGLRGR